MNECCAAYERALPEKVAGREFWARFWEMERRMLDSLKGENVGVMEIQTACSKFLAHFMVMLRKEAARA